MFIKCIGCLEVKDAEEFSRDKKKINGRASRCRVCKAEYGKEYRASPEVKEHRAIPEVKEKRAEYQKEYKKEWNPSEAGRASNKKANDKLHATPEGQQKRKVRHAVEYAITAGRLIRPDVCDMSMSSENCEETKVEAHHFLGYDWFNRFNVQWLCKKHHEMADNFQERARAIA